MTVGTMKFLARADIGQKFAQCLAPPGNRRCRAFNAKRNNPGPDANRNIRTKLSDLFLRNPRGG